MADKKQQKTWEIKLAQQQEELDRREAAIAALEKRYAGLQAKADELRAREEALKVREDRASQLEFQCRELNATIDEVKREKEEMEKQKRDLARRSEALTSRIAEFERDAQVREEELSLRVAELAAKEQKVAVLREEGEQKLDAAKKQLAAQQAEVQSIERDLKMRRLHLSEENSHLQQWQMELRGKEEEHEQYEKLFKDMEAVDERSRRQLKWQEDDLQRRLLELNMAKEDHAAQVAHHEALKKELDEENARIKAAKKQNDAQQLSIAAKTDHLQQFEQQLASREEKTREGEEQLKQAWNKYQQDVDQLNEEKLQTKQLRRQAEIDMKRAVALREKSADLERVNNKLSVKLQRREAELHSWDNELDWRETEYARSIESAMGLARHAPETPDPSQMNKAILSVQMKRMREQYSAGRQRRVISALQPQNRAQSAQLARTCSPAAAANSPAGLPPRPTSSSAMVAEVSSESHLLKMQKKVASLERDFRFYVGKVLQMQQCAPTEDERERLMAKHFTQAEQVAIHLALARERDIGTEAGFRSLVSQCPLATSITTNPVELVEQVRRWWQQVELQHHRREETIAQERVELLGSAVEALSRSSTQVNADIRKSRIATQSMGAAVTRSV